MLPVEPVPSKDTVKGASPVKEDGEITATGGAEVVIVTVL